MSVRQTCRTASRQQLPVLLFKQRQRQPPRAGFARAAHEGVIAGEGADVYLKALRRRGARAHANGEQIQGSGKVLKVVGSAMLAHGSHLEVSKGRRTRVQTREEQGPEVLLSAANVQIRALTTGLKGTMVPLS